MAILVACDLCKYNNFNRLQFNYLAATDVASIDTQEAKTFGNTTSLSNIFFLIIAAPISFLSLHSLTA